MDLTSEFYCTTCGNRLPYLIPRPLGSKRPSGHLKKIWCDCCGKTVNFCEIQPFSKFTYNDFKLELKYGNYDEEGNRKMKYGLFKQKCIKEGVDINDN